MKTKMTVCSSLEKVFLKDAVLPEKIDSLSLLSGERGNIQLCIRPGVKGRGKLSIKSELSITPYSVQEIYSALPLPEVNDDVLVLKNAKKGFYPDLLTDCGSELDLFERENYTVWLEISTDGCLAGSYDISITLTLGDEKLNACCVVNVLDVKKPEQELIHINWFYADCILSRYKVDSFSEEHWRLLENYMNNAAAHGINCLLTPLFTPPLDTEVGYERPTVQLVDVKKDGADYTFGFSKLERWIKTALKNGVKYFELSHLFTQWGAKHAPKITAEVNGVTTKIFGWETDAACEEYVSFLAQLGKALTDFTDNAGITEKCFIHCSDEPGIDDIEHYKKASDLIRKYFGKYKHIDALSDFNFYKEGLVQIPIPDEDNIEKFMDNVPELWTYYCCGHFKNNLPNRFFALPSIKNRILGVLLYKYNCKGFLQWGYNFWYTCGSRSHIDPYRVTDSGHAFSSGDAFIVYPGADGKPESSLRQKVFYDGLQDIDALRALEKLTSRDYVLDFIDKTLGDISFTNYPLANSVFLEFREQLCAEISKNS